MNTKQVFKNINAAFIKGAAGIGHDDVRRVIDREGDIRFKVFTSDLLQRFYDDVITGTAHTARSPGGLFRRLSSLCSMSSILLTSYPISSPFSD